MSNNSSNGNKQYWRKRERDYENLQEWRKKRLQEQLQQQTEHQDQSTKDSHPNSSKQQSNHVEIMEKLNSIGEQTENLQKEQKQQHNVVQNRISELQRQLVRIETNTASGEESRISIFPPIVIKQEKLEDANTTIITL